MKILALVPARGGSKRVPNKNIRLLGGKPLIAWTLDAIKGLTHVVDTIVSTDSAEIAEVASSWGGHVPWLRPSDLSTDTASSMDVVLHALSWYLKENGAVDGVMLLQPTSPFRRVEDLSTAISLFGAHHQELSVISFVPVRQHPYWLFRKSGDFVTPLFGSEELSLRSQDLPEMYSLNGSFYLTPCEWLVSRRTFYTEKILPVIQREPGARIDIDEPTDWEQAELYLSKSQEKESNA